MKTLLHHSLFLLIFAIGIPTTLWAQEEELSEEIQIARENSPYGLDPLSIYSIFNESYKTKDFELALMYGTWMAKAYPTTMPELEQYDGKDVFSKLIDIYKSISEKQSDPTVRSAYLDTSLIYFDTAFSTIKDDEDLLFDWTLKRGRFYQANADYINDGFAKAYDEYLTVIEMNPQKATELGDGYYVQITVKQLVTDDQKEEALKVINLVKDYADEGTLSFFDSVQDQLFSNPIERIGFLEEKLAETPEDTELLSELYDLYTKQDDLQKARDMAKELYQVDPNFENTRRMSEIARKNADYKNSIKYLNEAINKADNSDNVLMSNLNLELADTYLQLEDLKQARAYTRKSIQANSSNGRAYIKMANVYSQVVTQCASSEMTRNDKVVYWLVLDYLEKAKANDSSVTSTVNNQIKAYMPVTPTVEEKFYQGWEKGQKIKIDASLKDCYSWVNETTTVR